MGPPTILLVDEDPAQRQAWAECLKAEGFSIQEAASRLEAGSRLQQAAPRVVVVGTLSDDDEFRILVDAAECQPPVPVVLVAWVADHLGETEWGYILLDPVSPGELLTAVNHLLARTARQRRSEGEGG
jgi:DNA-binding response OmpR family regulator